LKSLCYDEPSEKHKKIPIAVFLDQRAMQYRDKRVWHVLLCSENLLEGGTPVPR